MRVALVGPYPVDPRRFGGGVETALFALAEGLATLDGVEVHVLTFAPGRAGAGRVESNGISVHYLPVAARLNNLTLYKRNRRTLRRALDELRPDIVHANEALRYGFVCLKAARREPVVLTIHGIVRETRKSVARRRDRLRESLAGVAVERYCIRNARYLIQTTRYPAEYFGSEIRGRIVDIDNGIAGRFFAATPEPEPGRVLFAGGVTPGKRLLDAVEAFASVCVSVPTARLRVASAAWDPAYAARVRARVRELRLEERIELLGALTVDEMIEEYRRASLFLLPSAQETSPLSIGEAMAVGVPVVATPVGGVPYLVEEGVTGHLVDVGDVAALAERVSAILSDDERRDALAQAAAAAAERRFRPAAVAARVRDFYEQALRETRAA